MSMVGEVFHTKHDLTTIQQPINWCIFMFEMMKDDQSRVVPEWCATVTVSAPDSCADGSSNDSCEDGKIPWILVQLFLEFMKHTNICQYSLHETHQEAFCSVNKQLCSSYLPLLRLSDSAC
jgi:hypothetical protein